MKNIERYPGTKDAIAAWDAYHDGGGALPFSAWAEQEVAMPTLLEVASEVMRTWHSQWQYGSLSIVAKAISKLSDAIDREKALPVRNCDKHVTAMEAYDGFRKICCKVPCGFSWLYGEADKEEAK